MLSSSIAMKRLLLLLPLIIAACTASPLSGTPTITAQPTTTSILVSSPVSSSTLAAPVSTTPYTTPIPFPYPTPYGWFGYELSPNGEWIAWKVCCADTGNALIVERLDLTARWEIKYDFNERKWWEGVINAAHWSKDGRYLYFAIRGPCDGCDFYFVAGIRRLDLKTGIITETLTIQDGNAYTFSFSPSESGLAYIPSQDSNPGLVIRDLKTWNENIIRINGISNYWAGGIVWSSDESKILFAVWDFEKDYDSAYIVLVNTSALTSKFLVSDYHGTLCPHEWTDDTIALLGPYCGGKATIQLDTTTGEITPYNE